MNEFHDELISAYLDGELTSEEQARVERALDENVELRQMFDELRVLRSTLQSLPREEPSSDWSQAVLRRAERAMLAAPAGSENGKPTVSFSKKPDRLRMIAIVATALVATVVLAIVIPKLDSPPVQLGARSSFRFESYATAPTPPSIGDGVPSGALRIVRMGAVSPAAVRE